MVPSEFEYVRPETLSKALAVLSERTGDCHILAGGQSLLPMLKLRLVHPTLVVDLVKISDISSIEVKPDAIEIGALTTERKIVLSAEIATQCPMLAETVSVIADPHVRNMGTIGGSLCLADPRGDLPSSVLALDATLIAASTKGTRAIPADEFFIGPFTTSLRPDELLASIRIPVQRSHSGAYVKLSRRAGDFAVVAVAANVGWDRNGNCSSARIALCAVAPTPVLVKGLNGLLAGSRLEDGMIDEAAHHASATTEPFEDPLVSVDYRKAMIFTMVQRALRLSRERVRRVQ
jgi:carbon-monoxide dehydrogenase medium subunit